MGTEWMVLRVGVDNSNTVFCYFYSFKHVLIYELPLFHQDILFNCSLIFCSQAWVLTISDGVFNVPFPYRGIVTLFNIFTSNFLITSVTHSPTWTKLLYSIICSKQVYKIRAAVSLETNRWIRKVIPNSSLCCLTFVLFCTIHTTITYLNYVTSMLWDMRLLEPHWLRSLIYVKSLNINQALISCQSCTGCWSQLWIEWSKTPAFLKIDQITTVFWRF